MKILTAPFILPITSSPIVDGAVVIDDGQIVSIGKRDELLKQYPQTVTEEWAGSVLMPGLVNAHTHFDLLFLEAKGETINFFEFLIAGWNHRNKLNPTDRRYCLEEGIRQSLRSGTTTVGDAGQYVGVIAQAVNNPMRMVLFPELLSGGDTTIQESYEGALSQVEEILGAGSGRLTAGMAPYAAYTLSRHLLKIVSQQAAQMRLPVKIHVAETFSEMQFFYESKGEIADILFPKMGWKDQIPLEHRKTPVQYLESIGFLETAPTLIGCNHLADPDLQILVKCGAKVVHSPRANAHLKLGIPPIKKLRAQGVPVALGTDGTASLFSLSVWDEMRYIQDHYPDSERPSASDLLKMATLEGACALGLEERIGSLEPGKEADLIAVRIPRELTASDLPSWLVSHVTPREIAAVFVEGKRVKL